MCNALYFGSFAWLLLVLVLSALSFDIVELLLLLLVCSAVVFRCYRVRGDVAVQRFVAIKVSLPLGNVRHD